MLTFTTLETRGELEPKYVPQLLLGSLLGTRQSAMANVFPRSLKPSQKSLRKLIRPSFFLVSYVANV